MFSRPGLKWEGGVFSSEIHWTLEPSIIKLQNIASKVLGTACTVTFFAQGGFNKLYLIECKDNRPQRQYLIRVSLPVEPMYKTLSEVNTIAWIKKETSIPVPTILAYDCSHKNELGFEWLLMEKIPGRALEDIWTSLSMTQKKRLAAKIAHVSAELFSHRFSGIGSLYLRESYPISGVDGIQQVLRSQNGQKLKYGVGKIISMKFFWDEHYKYNIARGPFGKSTDWLRIRLIIDRLDCKRIIQQSTDKDEVEEAEGSLVTIDRLLRAMNSIFKQDDSKSATALFHDDLSAHNILVDKNGELTGVVDWECTPVVPLWKAAQLPALLMDRQREDEPKREEYSNVEEENGDNSLYHIDRREYEITQLRNVFLEEMGKVNPEWMRIFNSSDGRLKTDFELATTECGPECFSRPLIEQWLDSYERGEEPKSKSLYARIMG